MKRRVIFPDPEIWNQPKENNMNDQPNPATVAAIYNLDLSTLLQRGSFDDLRRLDGTPASAEEIEALKSATADDLKATVDMHLLAAEREQFRADRMSRIGELYRKYSKGEHEVLAVVEARMTPEDLAECRRLWDDLGGIVGATTL